MESKVIHARFPFYAAALFLFLLSVIVGGAWYYYQHQEKNFKIGVQDELSAVANLKMEQIVSWRKERLADAEILSTGSLLISGGESKEAIRDRFRRIEPLLAAYKRDFGYYSLIITDRAGRVLENIGDTSHAPLYVDTAAILQTVSEKKMKVVDFYRCPACGRIHLDVLVPVFASAARSAVAGVAVLRRDPELFLFPLIQTWPVPSRSSETLLLRQEGDSIVYLNELRHRKGTALRLRFPLSVKDLPAARVARGQEGFMEGTDYRGEKVFAVGRHIPDSPWYIIAKVDQEEVLAPLRAVGRTVLVVAGLFAAVLCSLLVLWWMAYDRKMLMARHREEMAREQAEEGLRESEEKFRNVFDNSSAGKSITSPDGRVNVNRAFCEMLGYTKEELAQQNWQNMSHPDDIELTQENLRQLQSGEKKSARFIKRYLKKDGSVVWADVGTVLQRDKNGSPVYFITSVIDITERKRAEEALRKNEELYRSTLNNMMEGCQIIGFDWRYLYVNEVVAKQGRRPANDFVGRTMMECYPGIETTPMFDVLRQCMKDGQPRQMENEFVYPDGAKAYFQLAIQPNPEGVFILSIDITERRLAEEEVTRLNGDLTQKNAELEQLVYIASHDLRSPLVNVQGFSKEMGILVDELAAITAQAGLPDKQQARLRDIVSKEFPEARNYVLESVVKMDALLKGLLKFSRLGRAALDFQKIDMDKMLSGVVKTLEYKIQQSGARVETAALPRCTGDPDQISQVFTNLIDNAVKYLSPDRPGVILITGKTEKGFSAYCVEDNGIGIAPQHQSRAFEIYHRLEPRMCEGEGLGLAIVKKLVSRLNGSVRLESEPGKGSRFFVSLPGA